jgi:hypothetical protein
MVDMWREMFNRPVISAKGHKSEKHELQSFRSNGRLNFHSLEE